MSLLTAEGQRGKVSRTALWFGLLGGGVAWLAHLTLAYVIAEFGCVSALKGSSYLGISAVAWLLLGMSAATLLLAGAATLVAYRSTRRIGEDARAYVAISGLVMSGLFVFVILVESVPIFYYLRDC